MAKTKGSVRNVAESRAKYTTGPRVTYGPFNERELADQGELKARVMA
jgi:hypothetical protein